MGLLLWVLCPPQSAGRAWPRFVPQFPQRTRTAMDMPSLPDPSHSTCLTDACVRVASKILEALDVETDPCQDFYQYSCGGWIKRNPLPNGRSKWSTFNSIWDQNQAIMKHLLGRLWSVRATGQVSSGCRLPESQCPQG